MSLLDRYLLYVYHTSLVKFWRFLRFRKAEVAGLRRFRSLAARLASRGPGIASRVTRIASFLSRLEILEARIAMRAAGMASCGSGMASRVTRIASRAAAQGFFDR